MRAVCLVGAPRHTALIDRLLEAGAWTDAAFALIELEAPKWKIRRLVREGDEWLCSLSRQPSLPLELDDVAEASHKVLSLAVLRAFVVARTRDAAAPQAASVVPRVWPASDRLIFCCDNYA
jgi:hypothetical protein